MSVWEHWNFVSGVGKKEKVECVYCQNQQLKNATKCRNHLSKCLQAPQQVRQQYMRPPKDSHEELVDDSAPMLLSNQDGDFEGDSDNEDLVNVKVNQHQLLRFRIQEQALKLKLLRLEKAHFKRKSELEIELLQKKIKNEELKFSQLSGEEASEDK